MFAFAPSTMAVRGCSYGTGLVTIQGTNVRTGKATTVVVPLLEARPGSGQYLAKIPPLWPVHGATTVSDHIYCFEAIAPTADVASGGNIVTIHGSGFTGVRAGAKT